MGDLPRIVVEFVRPDGCVLLRGHRVRVAPGSGGVDGDIYHEAEAGVMTPVMEEQLPAIRKALSTRPALVSHLELCPRVRIQPRSAEGDGQTGSSGASEPDEEVEEWML